MATGADDCVNFFVSGLSPQIRNGNVCVGRANPALSGIIPAPSASGLNLASRLIPFSSNVVAISGWLMYRFDDPTFYSA